MRGTFGSSNSEPSFYIYSYIWDTMIGFKEPSKSPLQCQFFFSRPVPEDIRYDEVEFHFSVRCNNGNGFEIVNVCARCTFKVRGG